MNKDKYGILYSDDWSTVVGIAPGHYDGIKIIDGVTKIAPGAFKDASHIESLKLPMSLKEIGDHAFNDKIKRIYAEDLLENITIRSGEYTIMSPGGECALPFKSVVYETSSDRTSIGVYPCGGKNLESIVINSSVDAISEIAWGALQDATSLKEVTVNASIKRSIMPSAFSGCYNLETVKINGSLGLSLASNEMVIREEAFGECRSLESFIITGQIKGTISRLSFLNCSNFDMSIDGEVIAKVDESTIDMHVSSGCINGHEYVDLGLPSGLKWSVYNVGARSIMSAPQCYQWGVQNESVYKNWPYVQYLNHVLIDEDGNLTQDFDMVHIRWGEPWRMPTRADFQELIKECVWERIDFPEPPIARGITSFLKATGPNGKSIYFPKTKCLGWSDETSPYLTSTRIDDHSECWAFILGSSNQPSIIAWGGNKGGSIRPVAD